MDNVILSIGYNETATHFIFYGLDDQELFRVHVTDIDNVNIHNVLDGQAMETVRRDFYPDTDPTPAPCQPGCTKHSHYWPTDVDNPDGDFHAAVDGGMGGRIGCACGDVWPCPNAQPPSES